MGKHCFIIINYVLKINIFYLFFFKFLKYIFPIKSKNILSLIFNVSSPPKNVQLTTEILFARKGAPFLLRAKVH